MAGFTSLLIAAAVAVTPTPAPIDKPVSIVLVHGAFVDGSGWQGVHDLLIARGYEVLVVQNPTITLAGDVAATEQVIAMAKRPVVLVGHSYGGAVVTAAGTNPKVKSIVYIAAFAPDTGESVAALNDAPVAEGEVKAPLLPPQDGFLIVDPAKFPGAFAADVDPAKTRFMAVAQVPWGLGAVTANADRIGWKLKPSYFMITTNDRMVPPSGQRRMAKRAGAQVVEIESSHAVMLAHPAEVAAFIEKAVDAK